MKRIISIVLSIIVLTMTLVSCEMFDLEKIERFLYAEIDGGIVITGMTLNNRYSSLDVVEIPEDYFGIPVVEIADNAFLNCTMLKSITIPNSVKKIGKNAFDGCSQLEDVVISSGVEEIGEGAFANCISLKNIKVDENNNHYKSFDGNLFTKDGEILIEYASGKDANSYIIPEGTKTIADKAFFNSPSLVEVTLPNSLTAIGNRAFERCASLKSIEIPDSVTQMGEKAFYECFGLESVKLSANITNIPAKMFLSCTSLKEITIPEGVTVICDNAFGGCSSLTEINIPLTLTKIDHDAFMSADSLNTFYYAGTVAQWKMIEKGTNWISPMVSYKVVCEDATINK